MYQSHPPRPPAETLPTMYDLPSEDPEEPGLPDEFHDFQPKLLRETCVPPTYPVAEMFMGADLNLYYDTRHPQWYKRPDWFLVLGVTPADQQADLRWSYVTWQEGIAPFLVVELLSPGTEDEDLGQKLREISKPPTKWEVYESILRVPFYVVCDRYENNFRVFQLQGDRYQAVNLPQAQFWFEALQLGLGLWSGAHQGVTGRWLRWYDEAGNWIPTQAERAEQERQRAEQAREQAGQERERAEQAREQAEQERERAEQEQQRADQAEQQLAEERRSRQQLLDKLKAMGINPEDL
jgi:Uma2 family endonuclease